MPRFQCLPFWQCHLCRPVGRLCRTSQSHQGHVFRPFTRPRPRTWCQSPARSNSLPLQSLLGSCFMRGRLTIDTDCEHRLNTIHTIRSLNTFCWEDHITISGNRCCLNDHGLGTIPRGVVTSIDVILSFLFASESFAVALISHKCFLRAICLL